MGNLKEIDTETQKVCAVCNESAPHTCSICKSVAYCSKEHQKQHWKEHKSICQPYEVKSNEELGRYLVASRNLSCDDKIVAELPLVLGPLLTEAVPMCVGCYRIPTFGARCPGCLWPICHPRCPGLKDPHHHAIECVVLSLNKSSQPTPTLQPGKFRFEIITPLRCLLLQKRNIKKWNQLLAMESHSNLKGPDTVMYRELDEMIDHLIENYLSKLEGGLNYSKEVLHKICDVVDVNALEILSHDNIQLLVLHPIVSIMEHNCLPNTMYHYTQEYKIVLTPNKKIKKGDHLSISYTNVLWGTFERREYLKHCKYFECRCERCSDPTEFGTYMSALKCHGLKRKVTCGGWQLPVSPLNEKSEWKCNKCPAKLTSSEVRNWLSVLIAESDKVIKQAKPKANDITELVRKLQFFLHPNHFLTYEAKHLMTQVYGHVDGHMYSELSVEQLQNKEGMCRELLALNEKLDPGCKRLSIYTAVLIYELQSTLTELIEREIIPPSAIQEGKTLLTKADKLLEFEFNNTTGANMRTLTKQAIRVLQLKG